MFNILLTKKLSQEHLDLIKLWRWNYEVVETLNISPVEVKEVPLNANAWVVSSRNSFDAIKKNIGQAPEFIYCVGDWTKNEIEKLGAKVKCKSFENMKSLASDLAAGHFKSVVYFCGDEHRQDLEEGLKNTGTKISKMITHQSTMMFPLIKKSFDAVFVFSPRSVESLLKHNQFPPQTVFACIGQTTAYYLRSRGVTNIFTASYPDSKILVEEFYVQSLKINF